MNKLEKRHPVLIILSALIDGNIVEIEGQQWAMDEQDRLGMVVYKNDDKIPRILISVGNNWNINFFIKMCNSIPKDDLCLIAANCAVNKMNKE